MIHHASKVRWEWNRFRNPPNTKLYFKEYIFDGDRIDITTNIDWNIQNFKPKISAPAVEITNVLVTS